MSTKPTSKAAHEYIKPHKPSHKQKIIEGLQKLKIGGTFEQLSLVTGLREDQCWKRMVDLVNDGKVFDTGITRQLKSGLQGIVWQLVNLPVVDEQNPKTDREVKQLLNAGIKPHFSSTQANLF